MRGVWGVEVPAATLLTQVCLYRLVQAKLLTGTDEVCSAVGMEPFCWASESEEASKGIYAAGCVHSLDDFEVHGSRTHAGEHDNPPLILCQSSSGASCSHGPRSKDIKANVGKRRAGFEPFRRKVRHALLFQLST